MTTKTKAPCAWVSSAFMDSSRIKPLDPVAHSGDRKAVIDMMLRNLSGEPMPAERFPKEIYVNSRARDRRYKSLPDFFSAGGLHIVSAALADVLRRFDLGRTSLYPTRMLHFDRTTPIPGEYFCINFGERKASFRPEASPRPDRPWNNDREVWAPKLDVRDDDIALSEAALEGVDLWLEEPHFTRAFFLSNRLAEALRAAKLTRDLSLRRCLIAPFS